MLAVLTLFNFLNGASPVEHRQPGGGLVYIYEPSPFEREFKETFYEQFEPEYEFIERIQERIEAAQERSSTDAVSGEIGALLALTEASKRYAVYFETLEAAKAALEKRAIEIDEEDMALLALMLAADDGP